MAIPQNPFDSFRRKKFEPQFYLLKCCKCSYSEEVELQNKNLQVIITDEKTAAQERKVVTKLPKKCPHCEAKLKQIKMPSTIRY